MAAKKIKFADRVMSLREERGKSQTELAKDAGYSAAFFSRLMQGDRELRFEHVIAIANALGTTAGDLIAGTSAEDIATKWVEYEKFDEAERARLAAVQELEVRRRENDLLREQVTKLATVEQAAQEVTSLRSTVAGLQTALVKVTAERNQLYATCTALSAEWESCKQDRTVMLRTLENAQRQVMAVQQEAARARVGAGVVAGLGVLGVLIADSGSKGRRR